MCPRWLATQTSYPLQWDEDKWQNKLEEELPMWPLVGSFICTLIHSIFLSVTFLDTYFLGGCLLVIMGFKDQNLTLRGPDKFILHPIPSSCTSLKNFNSKTDLSWKWPNCPCFIKEHQSSSSTFQFFFWNLRTGQPNK